MRPSVVAPIPGSDSVNLRFSNSRVPPFSMSTLALLPEPDTPNDRTNERTDEQKALLASLPFPSLECDSKNKRGAERSLDANKVCFAGERCDFGELGVRFFTRFVFVTAAADKTDTTDCKKRTVHIDV